MKKIILSIIGVFLLSTSFAFAYQSKYNWQWNDWPQSWTSYKTVSIDDVSLFGDIENAKIGDKVNFDVDVIVGVHGDLSEMQDDNIKMTAKIYHGYSLEAATVLGECSKELTINQVIRGFDFRCTVKDFLFKESEQGSLEGYNLIINLESDTLSASKPRQGDFWNRRVRFKVNPKDSCSPSRENEAVICGNAELIVKSRDSNGCVKDYKCLHPACSLKLNTCTNKKYIFKDLPDTKDEYKWQCSDNQYVMTGICTLHKPTSKPKPVNFDVQKIIPIVKLILATDNEELKSLLLTILVQMIKG